MSSKDPSKTEKPTSRRVKKARDEGNVLMSNDVSSLVLMLGGASMCYVLAPMVSAAFAQALRSIMEIDCRQSWTEQDLKYGATTAMLVTAKVFAPMGAALCLCGVGVMRMQVGKYFSMQAIKWKFNNFQFQQVWNSLIPSKESLTRLVMTFAKVALIGVIVYLTVEKELKAIAQLSTIPLVEGMRWVMAHCMAMVFKILALFLAIAVIDWLINRHRYYDNLMMSKQEIKDEHRNSEGDPLIKGKIRQKMRELLRGSMMKALPEASVVVTNPTHVAVALKYEMGGQAAPMVVAKGLRLRAERIKELARVYRIPVVESPPLARSLYRNIKVGGYITEQFYSAVAALLAKLHRSGKLKLKKKNASGAQSAHNGGRRVRRGAAS